MAPHLLNDYEQAAANAATKIYLVEDGALDDSDAPAALKQLARANGFNGEAGAVLSNGEAVLLGVGDKSDPFITAAAAEKLVEGEYVFAGSFDKTAADLAVLGWLLGSAVVRV